MRRIILIIMLISLPVAVFSEESKEDIKGQMIYFKNELFAEDKICIDKDGKCLGLEGKEIADLFGKNIQAKKYYDSYIQRSRINNIVGITGFAVLILSAGMNNDTLSKEMRYVLGGVGLAGISLFGYAAFNSSSISNDLFMAIHEYNKSLLDAPEKTKDQTFIIGKKIYF